MKILPSFTHPQVVANLYDFFLLLNTKEDILKNDWNYGIVDFFFYYGSQWCQSSNHSSKYLPLCSAEDRNHTGLQQLDGE